MQFCRIARAAWIWRSFTKAGKYKVLWLLHGGNSKYTAWQRKTMIEVCAQEKISSSLCRKRTTPSIPIGRRTRCLATTCMIISSANGCPPSITGSRLRINRRITLSPATSWAARARLNFAAAPSGKFAAAAVLSVAPVDFTRPAAGNFAENIKAQYIRANLGPENTLASPDNVWAKLKENKEKLPPLYFACGTADAHYTRVYLPFKAYAEKEQLPSPSEKPRGTIMNGAFGIWKSGTLTFFGL